MALLINTIRKNNENIKKNEKKQKRKKFEGTKCIE